MRRSHLGYASLMLFASSVWAQGVQNSDMSFMAGPAWVKSQVVAGSNVTLSASTGYSMVFAYGYQVARMSAASLWIEFVPNAFITPGTSTASITGSVQFRQNTHTLGVRFMVPVQSRISVYGAAGGGAGSFHYATIDGASNPSVKSISTLHGVFDFGGGADIRLSRYFSIRGELRDYVTGRGLAGVAGRHHLAPSMGLAFHF